MGDGTTALRIEGTIAAGDAARIEAALQEIPLGASGERLVMLASGGGVVSEAFAIGEVFNTARVMAIIGPGDLCASSCVILFIAADARLLFDGGQVMFHPCEIDEARRINAFDERLCQEDIATNAGFVDGYPPDWIFTAINAAIRQGADLYVGLPAVTCFGMQQFIGMEHWGDVFPPSQTQLLSPCNQIGRAGTVTQARNWQPGPADLAGPEAIPPALQQLYTFTWTPPEIWYPAVRETAVALTFRRRDLFPLGPEMFLTCSIAFPGALFLTVRQAQTAIGSGGVLGRIEANGQAYEPILINASAIGPITELTFRLDPNIRDALVQASGPVTIELRRPNGQTIDRIETQWSTDFGSLHVVESFCFGRLPA